MRLFRDEDLVEEARPLSDRALDALEKNDSERLHSLLNEMAVGHRELHLLAVHWLARMFSKIRCDFGEPFLDHVLTHCMAPLVAPYAEQFTHGHRKATVAELIGIFRSMAGTDMVPLGEDGAEVVFALAPCGGGGRLCLEGWPQALPEHYAPCEDGTPIFCHGCKALQRSFNEACGATVWTTRLSASLPGVCEMRFRNTGANGERLFQGLELFELTKTRVRQALEKLFAGDRNIEHLIRDQQYEWLPFHDLFVQAATYILSAVHREKGIEYLDTFLAATYDSAFALLYPLYDAMDDVGLVRMFARVWHYHMAKFRIEEEDDRFVFVLDPCGSGGRLFRSEMHKGGFRYGDGRAVLVPDPHNITFNRRMFPIYCTHCASTNRAQFAGRPFMFIIDGHAQMEPGMPCRQYLYKKGAEKRIEPRILAQVGMSGAAAPEGCRGS